MNITSLVKSVLVPSHPGGKYTLDAWREKILNALLWTAAVLGVVTFLIVLPSLQSRGQWGMIIMNGLALTWLLIVTLGARLPYPFRAASAILVLYMIGVAALSDNALSGSGRVLLFAFAVSAGLLLGLRAGLAAALAGTLTLGVMGWLMLSGRYPMPPAGELSNSMNPVAWTIAAFIYLLLAVITVLPLGVLLQALETSLETERAQSIDLEQRAGQTASQLQIRLQGLEKRLRWAQAAGELAQLAATNNLPQVTLQEACEKIVSLFDYPAVALYRTEAGGQGTQRAAAAAPGGWPAGWPEEQFLAGHGASGAILARALRTHQVETFTLDQNQAPDGDLPTAEAPVTGRSVQLAAVPVYHQGQALGALVAAAAPGQIFASLELEALTNCSGPLGLLMARRQAGEASGEEYRNEAAYQAIQASRRVAQAETTEEILHLVAESLREQPFVSALLLVRDREMIVVSMFDPEGKAAPYGRGFNGGAESAGPDALPTPEGLNQVFTGPIAEPVWVVSDPSQAPAPLAELAAMPKQLFGCVEVAFMPVMGHGQIFALVVLGVRESGQFQPAKLRPLQILTEFAGTALRKVQSTERMASRLAILETLDTVSRAVSTETDLQKLFAILHDQVQRVMGNVNFTIALYHPSTDTIEIAYSFDGTNFLQVPPFPLGQGLTSILLRTRQPLLIAADAAERIAEMGALLVGAPARSWLGVPLLVAGEPIGALIVQDTEHEHRFDTNDQRLLVNLAGQVAAFIHNARLLETARLLAERENQRFQITNKIRTSLDVRQIMEITAGELAAALDARRVKVRLTPPAASAAPEQESSV